METSFCILFNPLHQNLETSWKYSIQRNITEIFYLQMTELEALIFEDFYIIAVRMIANHSNKAKHKASPMNHIQLLFFSPASTHP